MATLRKQLEALGFQRTTLGGNLVGYRRNVLTLMGGSAYILTDAEDVTRLPTYRGNIALELWDESAGECLAGFQDRPANVVTFLRSLMR